MTPMVARFAILVPIALAHGSGCFLECGVGAQYATGGTATRGWDPSYHVSAGFHFDDQPHRFRINTSLAAEAGSFDTRDRHESTGVVGVSLGADVGLHAAPPWHLRASTRAVLSPTNLGELGVFAGIGAARCEHRCGQLVLGATLVRVEEADRMTTLFGPQLRVTAPIDGE